MFIAGWLVVVVAVGTFMFFVCFLQWECKWEWELLAWDAALQSVVYAGYYSEKTYVIKAGKSAVGGRSVVGARFRVAEPPPLFHV